MTMLDTNLKAVASVQPQVVDSDGAVNGTGVALDMHLSATVVFSVGAVTDGTFTPTVEESTDGSTGWTTVAADDLKGTLVAVSTANDPLVQTVVYQGDKANIRPVITAASTTSGAPCAAYVILGDERHAVNSASVYID